MSERSRGSSTLPKGTRRPIRWPNLATTRPVPTAPTPGGDLGRSLHLYQIFAYSHDVRYASEDPMGRGSCVLRVPFLEGSVALLACSCLSRCPPPNHADELPNSSTTGMRLICAPQECGRPRVCPLSAEW